MPSDAEEALAEADAEGADDEEEEEEEEEEGAEAAGGVALGVGRNRGLRGGLT